MKRFIFTCGDINGIGLEIIIKTLNKVSRNSPDSFVITAPLKRFEKTASKGIVSFDYDVVKKPLDIAKSSKKIVVYDLGKSKLEIGKATKESAEFRF